MGVRSLPGRQSEVMGLVMHANRHHANEPEGPDPVRVRAGHDQGRATRYLGRLHCPALDTIHRNCVGRDHGADRAGDRRVLRSRLEAGAAFDLLGADAGAERHVVHVDQMLTQRLDIDFAPVRRRIRHQLRDNLLNGGEGGLPPLHDLSGNGVCIHAMALVGHAGHVLRVLHSPLLGGRTLRQRQAGDGKKCDDEDKTDHGVSTGCFAPLLQRHVDSHMTKIMQISISLVFQDARETGLSPGETLFVTGEDVATIFLVRSGRVHLQRHTTHGAQMVLQNAGPSAVIAEASAYSSRYHCDAVAAQASIVAGLPKERFLSALADDPTLAESWSALLARSVQAARLRSEIRSLPRVADRLDAWLGEENRLPEKGRWQEVAAELGVTREALYRELARRRATGSGG